MWAVFLLIALGSSSNSISAYTMDDNMLWTMKMAQELIQFIGVGFLANSYRQKYTSVLPLYILWFLCLMRLLDRAYAFGLASQFDELVKLAADFMALEREVHVKEGEDDPLSMKGYNYLVAGEEEFRDMLTLERCPHPEGLIGTVTTTETIWQCKGHLLSEANDPGGQLKDVCLSFALFKLLQRQIAGYKVGESNSEKYRKFVLHGLLSNFDRTIRVIEVQLTFLYDFLYNKYSYTFTKTSPFPELILSSATVVVSLWVAVELAVNYRHYSKVDDEHISINIALSFLLAFTISCLKIWQMVTFVLSDWVKVALLCKYVKTPTSPLELLLEKVLGPLWKKRLLKPWSNTIGQYSFLEAFNYEGWFPWFWKIFNRCQPFYKCHINKGRKEKNPMRVEKEVWMALLQGFGSEARDGHWLRPPGYGPLPEFVSRDLLLGTGLRSLARNGVYQQLGWACEISRAPSAQIFAWHIVTSLCDIAFQIKNYSTEELSQEMRHNRIIAISLSGYCAYLQVFVPQLLPEYASWLPNVRFKALVEEANVELAYCRTIRQMYDKIMRHEVSCGYVPEGNLMMVAKLAKQLIEDIPDELRWKTLADFWVEFILYLSPSINGRAHAERLAEGGELITHLWALFSNAGILEQMQWDSSISSLREEISRPAV